MSTDNNPQPKQELENNSFNDELKRMIDQIKSIREIEWRTDTENNSLKEIKDELKAIKENLNKVNGKEEGGPKKQPSENTTEAPEPQPDTDKKKNQKPNLVYCFCLIAVSILSVFAFCAILMFFFATSCKSEPHVSIPFLISGDSILLILAIIIIVLACKIKPFYVEKE